MTILQDPGCELDERFAATVERELAVPGTRAPSVPLHVPEPLRASCVRAARWEPDGRIPESLLAHYGEAMPRARIEQLQRDGDVRELLHLELDVKAMPRLHEAIERLFSRFTRVDLDPREALGFGSWAALCAACPTVEALYSHALFGSGLPFLGAHPAERALMRADLDRGEDPLQVIDRRLSGNLVHELAHGRPAPFGTPWFVLEAVATEIGASARNEHYFPRESGVAVPGVAQFVLLGKGLARMFGEKAVRSLACGYSMEHAFGERVARVFHAAAWQDWLGRRSPPFVRDPLDAIEWLKLADAARGGGLDFVERAIEATPFSSAMRDLPPLVEGARALRWRDLPSWQERMLVPHAIEAFPGADAMYLVNELAPTFQTNPAPPGDGVVEFDVEACLLVAGRRPQGVFAEPVRWHLPAQACREVFERGGRRIRFEGLTSLESREFLRERLYDLIVPERFEPLPAELVIPWTSSPAR